MSKFTELVDRVNMEDEDEKNTKNRFATLVDYINSSEENQFSESNNNNTYVPNFNIAQYKKSDNPKPMQMETTENTTKNFNTAPTVSKPNNKDNISKMMNPSFRNANTSNKIGSSVSKSNITANDTKNNLKEYVKQDTNKPAYFQLKNWFQSGEFADGYQLGDVTKTILGTATDITQDLSSGILSSAENVVDIGANVVASIQSMFGFNDAAKATRDLADKNLSNTISSKMANSSTVGILYNLVNGTPEKIANPANLNYDTNKGFWENVSDMAYKAYLTNDEQDYEKSSVFGEYADQTVNLAGYTLSLALFGGMLSDKTGTKTLGNSKWGTSLSGGNIGINISGHTLNLPTLAIAGGMAGGLQEANAVENVNEKQRWTKALMGGIIEGTTEGLFGLLGVGGNELTDTLGQKAAERFSSAAGKVLAKLGFQASGEMSEEFLSYVGNFFVDNNIIDKLGEGSFAQKWDWKEVGEQMVLAFVSTFLTGGGTAVIQNNNAIQSAEEQLGRKLTDQEKADVTQAIIEEAVAEKLQEMYDKTFSKDTKPVYTISYGEDGTIQNIESTIGKVINNPNESVDIQPVIVKNVNNYYNIIDSNTGIYLDTSPYTSLIQAQNEFDTKMSNLDKATIQDINNKVAQLEIEEYSQIGNITTQMQSYISQRTENDHTAILNNEVANYTISKENAVTSQNESNTEQIEIDSKNFASQVDSVINGTFPTNDMLTLLTKTPQPLIDVGLTDLPITMTQKHLSTIMNASGKYKNANYHDLGIDVIKQLPKAISNPLDIVQSNTDSNSIVLTTYLADKQNRTVIASIKIDGKGSINDIRIDTNVITSAYGRNNYDKFMQENIKNGNLLYDIDRGVIKKVAGARLQLPRRSNSTTNGSSITNSISHDNKNVKNDTAINSNYMPNTENNAQINQSLNKFINAKDRIDRNTISDVAATIEIYHRGTTFIDNKMQNNASNSIGSKITKIDNFFTDYTDKEDLRKQAYNYAMKTYKNKTVTIKDININVDIPQTGIKKTFGKNQDNIKMQTANNLLDIIENGVYINSSKSVKNSNIIYHFFYSPVSIDNENTLALVTIKEDISNKKDNNKFYYHDIREIQKIKKDKAHAMSHNNVSNMLFEQSPSSIDNSISHDNKNVKNDTTIDNQSMQEYKNYTPNSQDDGVRSMKMQNNIEVDNQGKKLSKQQQEYFKDSKVRNENGNLKVVYHGTRNGNFTIFEKNKIGTGATLYSSQGKGFYFTDNKQMAQNYAGNKKNIEKTNKLLGLENKPIQPQIYIAYLNLKNPYEIIDNKNTINNKILTEFSNSIADKVNIGKLFDYEIYNPDDYNNRKQLTGAEILSNVIQDKYSEFTDFLVSKGFDGIVYSAYNYDTNDFITNYVAFNSNQIKNIDNINPTSNEDIRYMKKSTKQNIPVDKDIQKELHNRIQNAILSKNSKGRTYLGEISSNVINKIKKLLDIDVTDRRHVLADNDIRHMLKEHGNSELEKSKGQIAITSKDIEKIPDIINNYDRIVQGNDNNQGKTIRYIKKYTNNITYVVEVIPEQGNALKIKTMWKKPVKVTNSKITPSLTSKTKPDLDSSTSNVSIQQNTENVKEGNIEQPDIPDVKTNAEGIDRYIEQEIQKIEASQAWNDSIPVTKRSDIRKTIEDYLGLGIKKGHFRQQAYGIYNTKHDYIAVKEFKDIDNVLHEAGHALDLGNRVKIDKESIADELLQAVKKHGGYETDSRAIQLDEGFAEVIREYAIIPNQAEMDYPQTVAVIRGIQESNQNFDKFIRKVQEQTYNYIHQNPRNRVISNQSIGEQTDRIPLSKEWVKQEVMRNVWDNNYVLKSAVDNMAKIQGKTSNSLKASDNAYLLTRLASGVDTKAISMISNGYINENNVKLMPGLNQIGEILGNNPERFNDLRAYLLARRDTDYKAKMLKTGIRSMDSNAVIEQFKNDTQIQEAAKIVYDTVDGVLQYAVDNGLIPQENADSLRESNAFYIPMQRVLENDRGNQTGRRGAVADIIKRRTGSESDIKDVLENIVANCSNIIQQVENNNILKAFYHEGEDAKLTGSIYREIDAPMTKIGTAKMQIWETELKKQGIDTSNLDLSKTIDLFAPNTKVDANNLITSFIDDNGKRVYLQFNDELLFNSLMNMDRKFMSDILKINSKMNMPLRYGATMANIGFAIPNMISDTAQAAIYSTSGFIPVVDNALGVLDVLSATNSKVRNFVNKVAPEYAKRINTLYTLYEQSGSNSSTKMGQFRKSTQGQMADVYGTKNSKVLGIDERFKPLKRLLDIMTYLPEISEQSTRFRVFEKNYDYYKTKGNSETDARIMAAIEARDATQDFGRTGNITREINQLIPFSAARVGSIYTFAEKVKANPKQIGMRIAILTAIAMAIKGIGYDDKEIEELNQRKKDDNFVFKMGDSVITIKKPQGILRSMVNFAEYIQDLCTGHIEEGKEAERLGEWINNAIMDNMPADSVTGLVPNAVAPLIENAINKDFYYNTDIVKSYDLDLPDSEQYYDYNSQLAILLGRIFNYSPAKIDNLISGYFGGLGTQTTNIIDYVSGKLGLSAEKPEMGTEQNAVGKRFIVNVNTNSASIDEIYNRQTELTKKKNGGTITKSESEELENITEAISKLAALNKQIKTIKSSLIISGREKANQIRPLQEQKTDIARQALGKDAIYTQNTSSLDSLKFYPSHSALTLNGLSLSLTDDMKKEYEQLAYSQYQKYASQKLYSKEYLEKLESKCKDYAKKALMQKYKSQLSRGK